MLCFAKVFVKEPSYFAMNMSFCSNKLLQILCELRQAVNKGTYGLFWKMHEFSVNFNHFRKIAIFLSLFIYVPLLQL